MTSDGAFCSLDPKAASGIRAGIGNDDEASVDEGLIYIPARWNGWGTLMFEDLWPAYGDFDFNDFVVNYKIQLYMQNKNKVDAMLIGVRVKAVGGSIPYDLCLAMKGVKGGEIDQIEPYNSKNAPEAELVALNSPNYVKEPAVLKFLNIRENANRPAGAAYVNTEEGYEMPEDRLAEASFMVYFRNSIAIEDVAFDTFDFFLTRDRESDGRRIEIHRGGFEPTPAATADYNALAGQSAYTDRAGRFYYSNDGLVWAINIPFDIQHAYEKTDFLKAYPQMLEWAQSGGAVAPGVVSARRGEAPREEKIRPRIPETEKEGQRPSFFYRPLRPVPTAAPTIRGGRAGLRSICRAIRKAPAAAGPSVPKRRV